MHILPKSATIATSLLCTAAFAADAPKVTYTKDVAPILYANCTGCHRPGEIGPMSLMSYNEARPWAKAILKEVVQERHMPPWHSADAHGVFKNDRRLSEDQIATIAAWIEQGTPQGNPTEMPQAPVYASGWRLGEPDAIITLDPVDVTADGPDQFYDHQVKTNFGEDKWVAAIELRPSAPKVTHHILLMTLATAQSAQGGNGVQGLFAGWAAGTDPTVFPKGTGRVLKNGEVMIANMHYHPSGEAATDSTQLGFYFAPKDADLREIMNRWVINVGFEIPAGNPNHEVRAEWIVPEDSLLMTVTPHMHYRGNDMIMTAVFPDGTRKHLIDSPNYDFNWQTIYEYTKPIPMPEGTKIEVVGHFDNSPANEANPDPAKNVRFGPQSTDEMFIGIIDVVKATPEEMGKTGD